jgi:hypothetical protein
LCFRRLARPAGCGEWFGANYQHHQRLGLLAQLTGVKRMPGSQSSEKPLCDVRDSAHAPRLNGGTARDVTIAPFRRMADIGQ